MGWVPEYSYYRDRYGGGLGVEVYAEALPAAVRQVKWLVGLARIREVMLEAEAEEAERLSAGMVASDGMSAAERFAALADACACCDCEHELVGATVELDALRRAVCAAVDCIGEWGMGQVGGFELGDFSVTHYDNRGTTGVEQATEAILKELAGTGLTFIGAGR